MRYFQRFNGRGFSVQSGIKTRWACCDCGLVHDIAFVSEDGQEIGVAAAVNKRATAARRRAPQKITAPRAAIALTLATLPVEVAAKVRHPIREAISPSSCPPLTGEGGE